MKKFLQNLIERKKAELKALQKRSNESNDVGEVRAIGVTIDTTNAEIREAETQLAELERTPTPQLDAIPEARGFDPLATYGMRAGQQTPPDAATGSDSEKYKTAFMNFVCRGVKIPDELRASVVTLTSDAGAVIPKTILNEIVKELKKRGTIYSKIRKLNVQGGVEVPILSLKPKATWLGENQAAESQKLSANEKVSFSYYGLECKLSQSLLTNVVTLDVFQSQFVELATEAIIEAIEIGVFNGTGSGQMLGIKNDTRIKSAQKIAMTSAEFSDWKAWKSKVFGKMRPAYKNGEFYMGSGTFDSYIDGMTDKNGQPIGRVNYGISEAQQMRFSGKNVEEVENDVIESFDTAKTGDVVAVFVNMSNYAINSNMEMKVDKWEDKDTHEIKNNCMVILDGKLIDVNGVLLITKAAEPANA